ncbi:putative xyloglucan:xyloglucosyl transferase [Rosa chinensis]|uniref:Putative xyloglucan:xyloglucosyl transferase n=1 Tax=Rosa chinensis TaxID=74649 RepID=A0A2P6PUA5_ROSCH|nr:putative xyloglucan:xyloglucosyl transferase [Rosa chinensis]
MLCNLSESYMMRLSLVFFLALVVMKHTSEAADNVSFDETYVVRCGNDHISKLDQGREVQLSLDFISHPDSKPGNHDELDFEFLGTDGPVYSLQTNIFANDNGKREQRLHLWFDPTKNFLKYGILWNHRQVVFFVDNIPIRVFKNNTRLAARYPSQQMSVEGSIWNIWRILGIKWEKD